MGPGGIISAAGGLFNRRSGEDDRDRDGRREPGTGPGGSGGEAAGDGTTAGPAATPTEVQEIVRQTLQAAAPIVNFQNTQNVVANPFQAAESRAEALRMIMDAAADSLDSNAGRFAAAIDRRIRERRS